MSSVDISDKWYFTGIPCKKGHIAPRLKSNRGCKECAYARRMAYESTDTYLAWKAENKKTVASNWQKRNKGSVNANTRKRQASLLKRTPKWLTDFDNMKMKCLYQLAVMRTRDSGEDWHVDHIIPLQGKLVSGLHVPSNLRVVPAAYNISKNNSFVV
jgi:5-methylcytosine-specific restriction endonuclease McrA